MKVLLLSAVADARKNSPPNFVFCAARPFLKSRSVGSSAEPSTPVGSQHASKSLGVFLLGHEAAVQVDREAPGTAEGFNAVREALEQLRARLIRRESGLYLIKARFVDPRGEDCPWTTHIDEVRNHQHNDNVVLFGRQAAGGPGRPSGERARRPKRGG